MSKLRFNKMIYIKLCLIIRISGKVRTHPKKTGSEESITKFEKILRNNIFRTIFNIVYNQKHYFNFYISFYF